MANQTAVELLAERLGTDIPQASQLLDRFSAGMASVLLSNGRLVIEGLGIFSVEHDHAARSATDTGAVFMPPKERIAFEPRLSSHGETSRIVVERLGMEPVEAVRIAKALSYMFGQLRSHSTGFELRGFGALSAENGAWVFRGDSGLEELLNGLYDGLKGIELPGPPVLPSPGSRGRVFKPALTGSVALLLCVSGYFALPFIFPPGGRTPAPPAVSAPSTVAAPSSEVPIESPAPVSAKVQPDSLVLEKGRYTVITATFSSLKTARDEAHRLSLLGHRIMIWPVHDGGHRYYRLVTGNFAGLHEARDSLRNMPPGLSKSVYIQQAYKDVVTYGE